MWNTIDIVLFEKLKNLSKNRSTEERRMREQIIFVMKNKKNDLLFKLFSKKTNDKTHNWKYFL